MTSEVPDVVLESRLDDLMVVLTTDMEVITEYVSDADLTRLSSAQTQELRQDVMGALDALSKLEDCLRELCE